MYTYILDEQNISSNKFYHQLHNVVDKKLTVGK